MAVLRRTLEATVSGLLIALLAPPVAAIALLFAVVAQPLSTGETFDWNPGSVLLLLLGMTTGAYMLGGIPAFLAGLALPSLRRQLSPMLSVAATGFLGAIAYAMTSGAHLRSESFEVTLSNALPATIGVAIAAWLAIRIEKQRAEA